MRKAIPKGCLMLHCTVVNRYQKCAELLNCDNSGARMPCARAREIYHRAIVEEGIIPDAVPDCLRQLNLVVAREEDDLAHPVPPPVAAEIALRPLEEAVARLRREAADLHAAVRAYDAVYAEARGREEQTLTVVRGDRAVGHVLETAVKGCAAELVEVQPGDGRPGGPLQRVVGQSLPVLARGVRHRAVYQHSARSHEPALARIEGITARGAEVRTLAETCGRLVVCDRTVAFVPAGEEPAGAVVAVRHPALVAYLADVFERQWVRAAPVDPATAGRRDASVLSDLQRTILRAMVSGETDERIARRVGLSRRTVVAHICKAAERFGSSSRAQLGYLLAGSGLLDGEGDGEGEGDGGGDPS